MYVCMWWPGRGSAERCVCVCECECGTQTMNVREEEMCRIMKGVLFFLVRDSTAGLSYQRILFFEGKPCHVCMYVMYRCSACKTGKHGKWRGG